MRRRGPAYTFEPYERVPDGQTVRSATKPPIAGRLAYLGVMAIFAILLTLGIALNL